MQLQPSASSSARSSAKFSITTVVNDGEGGRCRQRGGALLSVGPPWVAQRCVTDTNLGVRRGCFDLVLRFRSLPAFLRIQMPSGLTTCHASRVIAAVFPGGAKTFEDHRMRCGVKIVTVRNSVQTRISHDSTHAISLSHKNPDMRTVKYRYTSQFIVAFLAFQVLSFSSPNFYFFKQTVRVIFSPRAESSYT